MKEPVTLVLRRWVLRGIGVLCFVLAALATSATAEESAILSLQQCVEKALLDNRALQIERINPEIARFTLRAAYGYYDPAWTSVGRRESLSDSGGLDPADFSRDAVYSADSKVLNLGLTGLLPSGMSYSLAANYANSYGERNTYNFESFSLSTSVSVQQPLLKNFWIDQGRMTIRVNKKNLEITELGVAYLTMDVINQVRQAYYELAFCQENQQTYERLVQVRRTLLEGVQGQLEAGTMTIADVQLAQSHAATAEGILLEARSSVSLALNALFLLLGDNFTQSPSRTIKAQDHLLVVPQIANWAESRQHGLIHRPDLQQLRQDVDKANIDLKYRRNQLFPSLDLVAGYARRGASTIQVIPPQHASASSANAFDQIRGGDNPSDFIGLVFSLPLTRTTERAQFRASKQVLAQARLFVKQKEEMVSREIADAIVQMQSSYERALATQRATEYAQQAVASEELKLEGGKTTVFMVLQLQAQAASAQAAENRARADYLKAVSQFEFAEASILRRLGINIEMTPP